MRRRAGTAGAGVALLALAFSGCASGLPLRALTHPRETAEEAARVAGRTRELSEAAQAAMDRGDNASALGYLLQLVALAPKSAEAHHRLGRVFQAEGRLADAEAAYLRALDLDREYVATLTALGSIEAALGRPRAALKRYDQAIEIDPRQSEAHLGRGRALEALGQPADALAAYFRALEFAPNSAEARLRVATIQLARNQPDEALARLDPLVEQHPDDPEARHQRGLAHLALRHIPLAVDDLKLASEKLPDRPDVYYHLALALVADQETRAALAATERALQLAPGFADARALSQRLRR